MLTHCNMVVFYYYLADPSKSVPSVHKRDTSEDGYTQETTTIGTSSVQQTENILHIINMAILSAFLIEVCTTGIILYHVHAISGPLKYAPVMQAYIHVYES